MKRTILVLFAAVAFACGQEHAAQPENAEHTINPNPSAKMEHDVAAEHEDPMLIWKWVNFGLLAAGLGYLIGKQAPPFFKNRNAEIARDIREATRVRQQAEARAAEAERRMASLSEELEKLRRESAEQMAHEGERIRQDTAQQMARIQHSAEQEIDSLAKHATQELKAFAAQLSIDLAEQRIRSQMNAEIQRSIVDRFVSELDRKGVRN